MKRWIKYLVLSVVAVPVVGIGVKKLHDYFVLDDVIPVSEDNGDVVVHSQEPTVVETDFLGGAPPSQDAPIESFPKPSVQNGDGERNGRPNSESMSDPTGV